VTHITNRNILYLFTILVLMSIGGAIGGMLFTVSGIKGRAEDGFVFGDANGLSYLVDSWRRAGLSSYPSRKQRQRIWL
jgi:hypothetical protein